jgi:hypothetical protein
MLKKIIAIIRLDILNTAIAIVAVAIAIRIFHLMFLFSPTEGEATVKQIPNLSNFLIAVTITYVTFRFIPFVANKLKLNNFNERLFFVGDLFFGLGFIVFLLVGAAMSSRNAALLPVIVLAIGVPSLCISSILHLCGLYHLLLQWIKTSHKERDR